jgi:hypothetical protein
VCFVWLSEETVPFALYVIKRLVFMTEAESVYCAVRPESLYRVGHEKAARLPFAFAFGYCINFFIYAMLRTRFIFRGPSCIKQICFVLKRLNWNGSHMDHSLQAKQTKSHYSKFNV